MTPALRKACERALHVVRSNGEILRGGPAVRLIRNCMGLGSPPKPLLDAAYWLVSHNRDLFSNFLYRGERWTE
ncbi:MAG: hypothetical protein H0W86_12865 [Armatimonadetes bacterium]|nr:hypothetical protein [Armatimonadota bacterium]